MVYFVSFHSILKHGIIFLGDSTNICHVFTLQKRIITNSLVYGVTTHVEIYSIISTFYLSHVITYHLWLCLYWKIRQLFRLNYLHMDWKTRIWINIISILRIFHVFRQVFPTLIWGSLILYTVIWRVLRMTGCNLIVLCDYLIFHSLTEFYDYPTDSIYIYIYIYI